MSDNNIEIRFGAQTGQLKDGTAQAAALIEQAIGRMEKAFAGMTGKLNGASASVQQSLNSIKESTDATAKSIEGTTGMLGRFIGVAAIIGVTKQFVDFADSIVLVDARLKLVTKSAEEFKQAQSEIYRIAQANNVGLAETTQLFTKLSDPIRRMGGDVREVSGIVDAFATSLRVSGANTIEASAATLQFAQAMASGRLNGDEFRSMAETSPRFMKALADGMNQPVEKLKQLAGEGKLTADVVGNALLKSLAQLKTEAAGLPDTVGGSVQRMKNDFTELARTMSDVIGQSGALAKVFGYLADYIKEFTQVLKDVYGTTQDTGEEFDKFSIVLRGIGVVIETVLVVFANLKFIVTAIAGDIIALGRAIQAVANGDFKAIPGIFADAANEAKKARSELDAYEKRVLQMTDNVARARQKANDTPAPKAIDTTPPKQLKSAIKPEDGNMAAKFELELDRLKLAHEKANKENGTFYEFSKEREAQFWEQKLKMAGLKEEQRLSIERKIIGIRIGLLQEEFDKTMAGYKLQLEAARNNMDERLRIATEMSNAIKQKYGADSKEYAAAQAQIIQIERAKQEQLKALAAEERANRAANLTQMIDLKEQDARLQLALGRITNAEMLALEQQFENERYAIKRAALQQLQATVDPNRDPVEYAKINSQIEELERAHQLTLGEIRAKSALDNEKYALQFKQGMETSLNSVLSSFLKGTMTIKDLMRGLATAILDAFTNMLAQWAAKQIAQWVMEKVGNKVSALGKIMDASAVAGANAVASTAAAPYPLNLSAPAVGASMSATAASFAGMLAAEQGFDVPAGVSPVTRLHEKEMVLPAKYADTIRDMAEGGGGGGQPLTVNISAVDAKSVRDLFMREGSALSDAIKRQARTYGLRPSSLRGA